MYIGDVHILGYVIIAILGGIVGYFLNWCNDRLSEEKSVFSREYFTLKRKKINYILILLMVAIYVVLLYSFGFDYSFEKNINLIKYLVLSPMLVSAFVIDYKLQIIPNRLNLTIFEKDSTP